MGNSFSSGQIAVQGFTVNGGGWSSQDRYPRQLGDVNGDGKDDIIGFGHRNIAISLGQSDGTFDSGRSQTIGFTVKGGGWSGQNRYPRLIGDINGDGRDDIIGFGHRNIAVSLGQSNGTFDSGRTQTIGFTVQRGGWSSQDRYPRQIGDVNGDGRDDIIGFGGSSVYVALGQSDGTFSSAQIAHNDSFTVGRGWSSQNRHPRLIGDINGDGRDDIIGFGDNSVYVALGQSDGTFSSSQMAYYDNYTVNGRGWSSQDRYPRDIADVNGDGRDDIIGFGYNSVYVALGQSDGTFGSIQPAQNGFTVYAGWTSQNRYPRHVGDVDGDGRGDIVGFDNSAVLTSLSDF